MVRLQGGVVLAVRGYHGVGGEEDEEGDQVGGLHQEEIDFENDFGLFVSHRPQLVNANLLPAVDPDCFKLLQVVPNYFVPLIQKLQLFTLKLFLEEYEQKLEEHKNDENPKKYKNIKPNDEEGVDAINDDEQGGENQLVPSEKQKAKSKVVNGDRGDHPLYPHQASELLPHILNLIHHNTKEDQH